MDIANAYRSVFASEEGKTVLTDICERGMMFHPCSNEEQMGRANLAKEILLQATQSGEGNVGGSVGDKIRHLILRFKKKKPKKMRRRHGS